MERPILIQVAMKVECEKLLKKIENIKEKSIKGYKFYEGTINNYKIVLLLSNVGLIQTSASLMLAINEYNPIAIINMGIAGSTSPNLHIKDIIIGTECLNINSYKTSIKEKNKGSDSINWELLTFLSGEEDKLIIEQSDKELIELTKKINIDSNVYYGRIGSGDCWNREIDKIISLNGEVFKSDFVDSFKGFDMYELECYYNYALDNSSKTKSIYFDGKWFEIPKEVESAYSDGMNGYYLVEDLNYNGTIIASNSLITSVLTNGRSYIIERRDDLFEIIYSLESGDKITINYTNFTENQNETKVFTI